jgi:hypothetical protein
MHSIEFSIIVCSNDKSKFATFKASALKVFGQSVQIIRIQGAKSLSEGYNLGTGRSKGRRIIFCHDDIEFISSDVATILSQDLERFEIVGVAGTCRLVDGKWNSSGHPFLHGQAAHLNKGMQSGYQLCSYGLGRDNSIVDKIQALDGIFIAVNRCVVEALRFDEKCFDGFHLYDLDFTYSAYLIGFRIAVDARIHLLHHSDGHYDTEWNKYALRFCQKHGNSLPRQRTGISNFIKRSFSKSLDGIRNEMRHNSKPRRIHINFLKPMRDGSHFMILRTDSSCSIVQASIHQEWPLGDDTVNYISLETNCLDWIWNDFFLKELFRTLKNTAILEIETHYRGGDDICSDTQAQWKNIYSCTRWPEKIRLNGFSLCDSALVLQSGGGNNNQAQLTYYQLDKHTN